MPLLPPIRGLSFPVVGKLSHGVRRCSCDVKVCAKLQRIYDNTFGRLLNVDSQPTLLVSWSPSQVVSEWDLILLLEFPLPFLYIHLSRQSQHPATIGFLFACGNGVGLVSAVSTRSDRVTALLGKCSGSKLCLVRRLPQGHCSRYSFKLWELLWK